MSAKAAIYLSQGDYVNACAAYDNIISNAGNNGETPADDVYRNGASAAIHLQKFSKAAFWLSKIENPTAEDCNNAIVSYEKSGDLMSLISYLERQKDKVSAVVGEAAYHSRLCAVFGTIGNAEGVMANWPKSDNKTKLEWFKLYFDSVKDSMTENELSKLCDSVLAIDGNNSDAHFYKAVQKYEKCEARYKKLLDDYEKKKNATTYAILKRDLKFLSADYREAKDMFENLRKLAPDNKSYIKYLINIYNSLDQGDKAKQLERLL